MMLSGSGGGGRREGDAGDKLGRSQDKQAGRERELESKLAEAAAREHKLRTQLARLEHIQKAAQGTALAPPNFYDRTARPPNTFEGDPRPEGDDVLLLCYVVAARRDVHQRMQEVLREMAKTEIDLAIRC